MILDILYALLYLALVLILLVAILALALPVGLLALFGYGVVRLIGTRRNA
jgi:hypothetical protein